MTLSHSSSAKDRPNAGVSLLGAFRVPTPTALALPSLAALKLLPPAQLQQGQGRLSPNGAAAAAYAHHAGMALYPSCVGHSGAGGAPAPVYVA